MTCSHKLRWYELIPVFSFLIQSGRCRRCASGISHQYPLVEFGTGLVFALIAFYFMPILSFSQVSYVFLVSLYAFLFSLLIVIMVYDMRHKIIPDRIVFVFIALAFFSLFVNHVFVGQLFITPTLLSLLSGPICALPFALIWLVSRGRWMGLGDAKLILGIGWMIGIWEGLAMLILSFWLGALVGVILMVVKRKKVGMKTEIPFAPFLIISTLVVFILNISIFTLAMLFLF